MLWHFCLTNRNSHERKRIGKWEKKAESKSNWWFRGISKKKRIKNYNCFGWLFLLFHFDRFVSPSIECGARIHVKHWSKQWRNRLILFPFCLLLCGTYFYTYFDGIGGFNAAFEQWTWTWLKDIRLYLHLRRQFDGILPNSIILRNRTTAAFEQFSMKWFNWEWHCIM